MRLEYDENYSPIGYIDRPYHHNNDSDSEVFLEDESNIRERTGTEKLIRDYGLYIAIIGGFLTLKVF
jgi:hypothetical protein